MLCRLFPFLEDKELYNKLQIDDVGRYSITKPHHAKIINNIIKEYIKSEHTIIVDAMASVGGNTISFTDLTSSVVAVEVDDTRSEALDNNIKIYGIEDKVLLFRSNYLTLYDKLEQDIVFLDPPWGGINYKNFDEIRLFIDNICIIKFINELKKYSKLVVLKCPIKIDLKYIKKVTVWDTLDIYDLNNMKIIVFN
jgi:predicted RNA methylase